MTSEAAGEVAGTRADVGDDDGVLNLQGHHDFVRLLPFVALGVLKDLGVLAGG